MDSVEQCLRWDFHLNFSNSELLSSVDLIFAFADLIFAFAKRTLDTCRCNLRVQDKNKKYSTR